MTTRDRMKLRFVSLTLVLALAAVPATRAAAEEAAAPPSGDAKATNPPAHSPDASPAGNNPAPASSGANAEGIDTRITVQPHGPPSGKSGRLGGATNPVAPIKLINPHRRTFSPSRSANRFAPNASGLAVGQRANLQPRPGERFDSIGVRPAPAIGTAGGAAAGSPGLVKPGIVLGHPPIVQPTVISPQGANTKAVIHGGIGGVSTNHHAVGSGTAGIGGPAHPVSGINGTSIREAH